MSTDDENNPPNPRPLDSSSEHASRNRIQLEMLKVAVERKKHAAYIEAMRERAAPGEPAADADKKESGSDR